MRALKTGIRNSAFGSTASYLLLSVAVAALFAPASAQTQLASAATKDTSIDTIEAVVVTAMKRGAISVQETPTSIGVISEADLKTLNVTQFSDFAGFVAGLNFSDSGPGDKRYIIRGMNSSGEAQTAVYYDNIPTTGIGGAATDFGGTQPDLDLYDVQQIEVLRGPQGTLYGSNSQSGVIHFVTNKPDASAFSASVLTDLSSTKDGGDNYAVHGMVNIPLITDKLALRVVGYHTYDGGFIDNPERGTKDVNFAKNDGIRASLKWDIDDKTTLVGQYFYQDLSTGGRPLERPYAYSIMTNDYAADGARKASLYSNEPRLDRSSVYALTLTRDLGWADLTVSSSDFKRNLSQVQDFTYSFDFFRFLQGAINYPAGVTIPAGGMMVAPQDSDLWSNEARIATKFNSSVNGVFGVYYSFRSINFENHIYATDAKTGAPDYSAPEISSHKFADRTQDLAFFGELTYDITDALSVTGGIRHYDTIRHLTPTTLVPFFHQSTGDDDVAARSENAGEIYKGLVNYKITDSAMVYVTYAQGFRAGGTNTSPSSYVPTQYGPDRTENYEIGAKTQWWQNRVLFNVALYHIILSDMQVTETFGPGGAFSGVGNVPGASARSNGVEGDFTIKPFPGLTVQASGSLTDAKLTKTISDLGSLAVKGTDLLAVPSVNYSLRAEYAFDVADGYHLNINGSATYTGNVKYHTYDEYNEPTPGYMLVNLTASLDWDAYEASLYVKNVFDKNAQLNVLSDVNDPYIVVTNQPRTIGLRFGAHW